MRYLRFFAHLLVITAVFLFSVESGFAHPFGGVQQRTVVSDLHSSVLIEYITHFGPEALLPMHPDKDLDGSLSEGETRDFLTFAHYQISSKLQCIIGKEPVVLEEIERKLEVDRSGDFKEGVTTSFTYQVPIPTDTLEETAILRIVDHNFAKSELNQLSYVVNVLGKTGPLELADEGRELRFDLSLVNRKSGLAKPTPTGQEITSSTENDNTQGESESLLKFLKNDSRSLGLYMVGFFTAFILGAFHALSPGHGKAMVAAYLVGTRGRIIDAVHLGIVVTITHVFSVLILGVVALVVSQYTLSKDLYPWLGVVSGVIIFLTGYFLLARTALAAEHHHHDHDHHHHHHEETTHSLKEVISLGVAGGMVPCPSAIVILLFAVAVGRIVDGLMLIVSFSLGLATILIAIGILTVTASKRIERLGSSVKWIQKLPVFTAGIIMILGVAIGINALLQSGILIFKLP
jgi:ABC-type nickel/cobalt efflux system permease component RcnA